MPRRHAALIQGEASTGSTVSRKDIMSVSYTHLSVWAVWGWGKPWDLWKRSRAFDGKYKLCSMGWLSDLCRGDHRRKWRDLPLWSISLSELAKYFVSTPLDTTKSWMKWYSPLDVYKRQAKEEQLLSELEEMRKGLLQQLFIWRAAATSSFWGLEAFQVASHYRLLSSQSLL